MICTLLLLFLAGFSALCSTHWKRFRFLLLPAMVNYSLFEPQPHCSLSCTLQLPFCYPHIFLFTLFSTSFSTYFLPFPDWVPYFVSPLSQTLLSHHVISMQVLLSCNCLFPPQRLCRSLTTAYTFIFSWQWFQQSAPVCGAIWENIFWSPGLA